MHHYCMEWLAFRALIKHICKTDLQKDNILCPNFRCANYVLISIHMQTLELKYSSEI